MKSMYILASLLVVAACGADGGRSDFFGTYAATRTVTMGEPSPDFQVPLDMTVTITPTSVETSTGDFPFSSMIKGTMVTFSESEIWPSPEGSGAASLEYFLIVPGDRTMSGSIRANVNFNNGTIFADFDFSLSIEGELIPADPQ